MLQTKKLQYHIKGTKSSKSSNQHSSQFQNLFIVFTHAETKSINCLIKSQIIEYQYKWLQHTLTKLSEDMLENFDTGFMSFFTSFTM